MAVKLVVAVTDGAWFDHLSTLPSATEVNFWAPSGERVFRALAPGELFLFKLRSPRNYIVGGGVFVHATTMPCSLAWEAFGERNGARTLAEMRARIMRLRHADRGDQTDVQIGCRILSQPFFLPEHEWIPVPDSWAPTIVSFKTYALDAAEGRALWDRVQDRVVDRLTLGAAEPEPHARFGAPVLIRPRLGQGAFRILVTDLYDRRCAVTRERTLPALDAAHIRPYGEGGEHEPCNGLLLRRDLHSLFDAGYVTVTPAMTFAVSRRIREEFDNGRAYYALDGQPVATPPRAEQKPALEALAWHNKWRFKG